jgi:hypothetical protein
MSAKAKRSYGSALALLLLSVLALYGGPRWLVVLIPVAVFLWYGASPTLRRSRN